MEAICIGPVASIISSVASVVNVAIAPLVQLIDDVIQLERNTLLLQDKLSARKLFLEDIANRFQDQQRSTPGTVNDGLQRLQRSLDDAESVINRSQQRQGCLDCRFCKPRLCRQIRECSSNIDERYSNLQNAISATSDTQHIVSSAQLQAEALLSTVPESGFVGLGIKSAEMQLNTWLDVEDHQFRVIGVFGMGGIGKTSLLKTVYNTYKLKGNVFQVVIWLTVSQKFNILDLQSGIAEAINLQLGNTSYAESSSNAVETRKMRLLNYLKENKFLLILDDMWNPIQLEEELGIPFVNNRGSKVVISSRRIDVIRMMGADDSYSIPIQPLSPEEGLQLFRRKAFKARGAPTKRIEDVATQIAKECKGLPLAINVVAAAMIGNTNADEWDLALNQMKSGDPVFRTMFNDNIDEGLYKKLKLSYDGLPDSNLQNCFLYCGAFPEDAQIEVERLVEMWIGEGLVNSRDKSHLMDAGRRYVTLLVERCLFEYASTDMDWMHEKRWIKIHDVVRDMALYIAEKKEKCLFRTSQKLHKFPAEEVMDDCKRIAIRYYNNTHAVLPTDFRCPKLRTLIFAQNRSLREVPNGFFLNLTSLRVLDLSHTNITSLPESLWQLKQLEFLGLNGTKIKSLPADICNLSQLQFLHLQNCTELELLPCKIKELKNLKHLNLGQCNRLGGIPCEISQLTSLHKLELLTQKSILGVDKAKSGMCSLKDFTNFPNLMELSVNVIPGITVNGRKSGIQFGTMGTWLEMRHLKLMFDVDSVMEDLPQDMQNMKKLQTFSLRNHSGISLPNCICDFERLEKLCLYRCDQLQELPPLEKLQNLRVLELTGCNEVRELGIGIRGSIVGFPMLETLSITVMPRLESISSSASNVVWTERTMPKLQTLVVYFCRALKRLPRGIEKLSNLKNIRIEQAIWERLIWEDSSIKFCLEKKVEIWENLI